MGVLGLEMRIVVFTDLDGTLLDHDDYSFEEAIPAIERLRKYDIPLILNSSKTKAEMLLIRRLIKNQHPFICENGCAVFYPIGYFDGRDGKDTGLNVKVFGRKYDRIVSELAVLRQETGYDFVGFSDLGVSGVAETTGLSLDKASNAMKRHGSEPIEWRDTAERLTAFRHTLKQCGLRVVKGGRFYHVMGLFDKADGLKYLSSRYERFFGEDVVRIALGDAPNDRSMLQVADYSAVIAHKQGHLLKIPNHPEVYYTKYTGPAGWSEAIETILAKLKIED